MILFGFLHVVQTKGEVHHVRVVVREIATVDDLVDLEDEVGVGAEDQAQDVSQPGRFVDILDHKMFFSKFN